MRVGITVMAALCLIASSAPAADIRWESFDLPRGAADVTAQLGRLTVPLMRSKPDAGSVELAFVRLRATKPGSGAPLIYLAGGPGDQAIGALRFPPAAASFSRLAQTQDVILLDQRGTGQSTPRPMCRAPRPLAPSEKFSSTAKLTELATEAAKQCVAEWAAKGVDVRGFTNAESAADIDDIRRALGVPKVSLFGFSYGTHLALAAMRYFPNSIERAVLVGTEGPDDTRKLPWSLDAQLGKLSLLAARDASINAQVPDMAALLKRVFAKLENEPIRVTVNDRATKQDVEVAIGADGLRRILLIDIGDGNDFPVFPALIYTIDQGDTSILAWFVEKRYNQITGGTSLMNLGMECSSGMTENRQREIDLESKTSVFSNAANVFFPAICSALPPVDLGDSFRGPLISDVPVLFISGSLDSNAPPYQAERLRFGMPRATHLVVQNAGHEDTLPNAGVQSAIADFLAGQDVSARHIALPTPNFMSVEEARRDRKR